MVVVVQQTFGGMLNFVPHLHVLVAADGLMESRNRWIHRLKYVERELMYAWHSSASVRPTSLRFSRKLICFSVSWINSLRTGS